MSSIRITATDDDIADGRCGSASSCAFALAFKHRFPDDRVFVYYDHVMVSKAYGEPKDDRRFNPLKKDEFRKWVQKFDQLRVVSRKARLRHISKQLFVFKEVGT